LDDTFAIATPNGQSTWLWCDKSSLVGLSVSHKVDEHGVRRVISMLRSVLGDHTVHVIACFLARRWNVYGDKEGRPIEEKKE
jgi:hypothetical protein